MLTDEDVAEYFRTLPRSRLRNNPAMTEAARALKRAQRKKPVAGPGRPRTVEHSEEKGCHCAECRAARWSSYNHEPIEVRMARIHAANRSNVRG